MNILVLGKDGQLGKSLQKFAHKIDANFSFFSKEELDINDTHSLDKFFRTNTPGIVLNSSAYTNVEKAEEDPILAFKTNGSSVENLARSCKKYNSKLIHISTDYIFDGLNSDGYREDHIPNPLNIYGKSKLLGEQGIRSSDCEHLILRTSWVFSSNGNNFFNKIRDLSKNQNELKIVSDQFGSPTYSDDIAVAIYSMMKFLEEPNFKKTLNFAGNEKCSWFEFASEIVNFLKVKSSQFNDVSVVPISSNEFEAKATRPKNTFLSSDLIESQFNIKPSDWKKAIREIING